MKAKFLIVMALVVSFVTLTSCASSRGGCKSTQGYVGYGSR